MKPAAEGEAKRIERKRFAQLVSITIALLIITQTIMLIVLMKCITNTILTPARRLTEYTLIGIVDSVNEQPNQIIVKDYENNSWCFYGSEDWSVGDCASLLINDNGTDSQHDDVVLSAQRQKWRLSR